MGVVDIMQKKRTVSSVAETPASALMDAMIELAESKGYNPEELSSLRTAVNKFLLSGAHLPCVAKIRKIVGAHAVRVAPPPSKGLQQVRESRIPPSSGFEKE